MRPAEQPPHALYTHRGYPILLYYGGGEQSKGGRNIVIEKASPMRHIHNEGPFDIIGDVHGCFRELMQLLGRLGYVRVSEPGDSRAGRVSGREDGGDSVPGDGSATATAAITAWRDQPATARLIHQGGRQAVFLGDITDRGPDSISSILLVEAMVRQGAALYVPGNHCRKLYRYFTGHAVVLRHGIETTLAELNALPRRTRSIISDKFRALYEGASVHLVLDKGKLVVAHAGIKEEMIGQTSKRIRSFCLFGDTTGERTRAGLPVRRDWARHYKGDALIVYGHTPVHEAIFRYNTINIDQGCVFGGRLTAVRYPERELVHVDALKEYDARGAFRHFEP